MKKELDTRTMFIGVGAAKAGTTWLYEYLRDHREVCASPIKEMHYFDCKYQPQDTLDWNSIFAERLRKKARKSRILRGYISALFGRPQKLAGVDVLRERVDINDDDNAYLDFFGRRLTSAHRAFGEFTPGYAALDVASLEKVKAIHPDMKILYVMRDPVQRFCSALKSRQDSERGYSAFEQFLEELNDNDELIGQTRYDLVHKKLTRVFDRGDLFFGFYESMFEDRFMQELCGFLGVRHMPANYLRVVNRGQPAVPLSPAMIVAGREKFRPVYDFAKREFGDRVPREWEA